VSGKKRCLFCGSTGLTREHVIAKWLRQELRTQGWVYEQRGTGKARKWNALAVVLPRVCHRCNNELLADLEDRAKPILGPLLHGGSGSAPILIDPSQQATLATWAVKTSLLLTIRSFEGEAAGWVPADNLQWLYDHRGADQPPPGAHVWMFGVDAANTLAASSQAACLSDDKGKPAAHVGTFTVGYVGFQMFCRAVSQPEFSADHETWLAPRAPFRDGMLDIWPASGVVRWPPRTVFDRDVLQVVASRLGAGLSRVSS
jgi:hypothetical protein